MFKYLSQNKDAVILGVIGNAVTAVLALLLAWFNILPAIQVPAWLALVMIAVPVWLWFLQRKKKKLVIIVDKDFGVERIVLDGKRFIQCRFNGSEFVFTGDAGFGLERNDMSGIRISFSGPASMTIGALISMHKDPALRPFVLDIIRRIQS